MHPHPSVNRLIEFLCVSPFSSILQTMNNTTNESATGHLDERREAIWQWIHAIPASRVATYGQIASLAGYPGNARLVGSLLSKLPRGSRLPWHRVINSQGRISHPDKKKQQELLAKEGVHLIKGRVSLKRYGWQP